MDLILQNWTQLLISKVDNERRGYVSSIKTFLMWGFTTDGLVYEGLVVAFGKQDREQQKTRSKLTSG